MKTRHPEHVALIIDSQKKAGTQNQAAMLALEMAHTGCQVTMLLLEHPTDEPLPRLAGVQVVSTPVSSLNDPSAIRDLANLVSCLRRLAPDVVHTFLFKANLVGSLAARLARVPVVVGSRRSLGYDLNGRRSLLSRIFNRLVDGVAGNALAVIKAATEIEGAHLPCPIVIPNGVEIPESPVSLRNDHEDRPVLGILGNIRPIKGHDVALKAFQRILDDYPQAQLHLMGDRHGDPDWAGKIDRLISDLSLTDNVHWQSPNQPVSEFLNRIDILVSASHSEGMPNAILEGMAAGLPVVATDVGGTSEVLDSSWIAVPPSDPQGLAAAISQLLRDPRARIRSGALGRKRAEKFFGPKHMARRHLDWYGQLLTTRPRAGLGLPWLRPRRKVVLAIDMFDTGGTEQQMIHWARGLQHKGIPVEIFCLRRGGRAADKLASEGIPVHILNKKSRFDPVFLVKQFFLLMKLRPMTVLALLTTAGIWTVPSARLAGVPRVLFSMRATALTDNPSDRGPVKLLTHALRFAHRIIGNSEPVVEYCQRQLGVEPGRTDLLPNAIEGLELRGTSRQEIRSAKGLPAGTPLVGIVARLVPIKDHTLFLKSCLELKKLIPQVKAVVIGDGPLQEQLNNTIARLGLQETVTFLGHRQDTLELIRALDALVLTSRSEGSPNSVLEALTVGTPVVSTDVGDVASLVGKTGGAVLANREPREFAQAIMKVWQGSASETEDLPITIRKHNPHQVLKALCGLIAPSKGPALTSSQGAHS